MNAVSSVRTPSKAFTSCCVAPILKITNRRSFTCLKLWGKAISIFCFIWNKFSSRPSRNKFRIFGRSSILNIKVSGMFFVLLPLLTFLTGTLITLYLLFSHSGSLVLYSCMQWHFSLIWHKNCRFCPFSQSVSTDLTRECDKLRVTRFLDKVGLLTKVCHRLAWICVILKRNKQIHMYLHYNH